MKIDEIIKGQLIDAIAANKHIIIMIGIMMIMSLAWTVIWKLFQAQITGYIGERRVRKILDQAKAPALHDVYIPHRGGVTQVDHIVLLGDKIAVVETKCYRGAIYGDETSAQWTVAYNPKRKEKLYNPLKQNATHLNAVRAIVGPEINVAGYIAMVGRAKFPNGVPKGLYSRDALTMIVRQSRKIKPSAKTLAAWQVLKDHVSEGNRRKLKSGHKDTLAASKARRTAKRAGQSESTKGGRREPTF